jgi:hypothetical protein
MTERQKIMLAISVTAMLVSGLGLWAVYAK